MTSSKAGVTYQNLRQNLAEEPATPSAPIYEATSIQRYAETKNETRREETIPLCASPSSDSKRRLKIEAEIKKAQLRKEQLLKERQLMEEEFKAKEMLLNAEMELALATIEDAEASSINNKAPSISGVAESGFKTNSVNAQTQNMPLQNVALNTSEIERPMEQPQVPQPLGLEQLCVLDEVSIRQLVSNSVDETYEVVAPGNIVILRVNLTFQTITVEAVGQRRIIKVDMFDNEVNEVINFRMGSPLFMEVLVGGRLACLVRRAPTCFKPMLMLHDSGGQPVLKIKGPKVGHKRKVFSVQTMQKHPIGSVDKSVTFAVRGYVEGNYSVIRFPLDLDVRFKAAIIASSFLICSKETVKYRNHLMHTANATSRVLTSD